MTGDPINPAHDPAPAPLNTVVQGTLGVTEDGERGPLTPTTDASSSERGLRFADFHSGYVTTYIQFADAKAGATFAVASGMLAYLLNTQPFLSGIRLERGGFDNSVSIASFILLLLSAALSFLVILPRRPKGQDDLVFWGSVAEIPSAAAFSNRVLAADDAKLASERLSNCYQLSRVCSRKYIWLRRSMLVGAAGLVATAFWWLAIGLQVAQPPGGALAP